MSNGELFIERLLRTVPELKVVYAEHLADNDNMLLPHVFMGDVVRFIVAEANSADGLPILQKLTQHLESELGAGSAEATELIRASFVENLIDEKVTVDKLKPFMGSNLLREIEEICGD